MLNKERFVNTMTGLCDMYGKVPSEFILNAYYAIFNNYSNEEFEKAITNCLKNRVYNTLPKPAEILEFLEGTRDDKALMAWLQVKKAVIKGGYYASVEFADPIISNCLNELGGWMTFCSLSNNEMPFVEKRFMDLYRLFLKRGINKPVHLVGFIELKNIESGYNENIPPPLRIGYTRKAEIRAGEKGDDPQAEAN